MYQCLLQKQKLLPKQWTCLSRVAKDAVINIASGPSIETAEGLHRLKALTHWNWEQLGRWLTKCVTVDIEVRKAKEDEPTGPLARAASAPAAMTTVVDLSTTEVDLSVSDDEDARRNERRAASALRTMESINDSDSDAESAASEKTQPYDAASGIHVLNAKEQRDELRGAEKIITTTMNLVKSLKAKKDIIIRKYFNGQKMRKHKTKRRERQFWWAAGELISFGWSAVMVIGGVRR